jgi:hypothetical protein
MIYLIIVFVVLIVAIFWLSKRKPGKPKRKSSGFNPDFSGIKFTGTGCECI